MIPMKTLTMGGKKYEIVDEQARAAIGAEREDIRRSCATAIVQTMQGKSVSANDCSDNQLCGLKIFGKSTQASTTGKNLLQNTAINQLIKGVNFTVNADGTIVVHGTATGDIYYDIGTISLTGSHIMTGCPANGSEAGYFMDLVNIGVSTIGKDLGTGTTVTLDGTSLTARIRIMSGVTVSNLVYKPMVRPASILSDVYEPYTGGVASPNLNFQQAIHSMGDDGETEIFIHDGNLLPVNYADGASKTMNGITFTAREDGSVLINGTASALAYYSFNYTGNKIPMPNGWLSTSLGNGYGTNRPQIQNDIYVDDVYITSVQSVSETYSRKEFYGKVELGASRIKVDAGVSVTNVVVYPVLCGFKTPIEFKKPTEPQVINLDKVVPGIQVSSDGTYTDSDGKQWICDEVDFERGVYIKRVGVETVTGIQFNSKDSSNRFVANDAFEGYYKSGGIQCLCNVAKWGSFGMQDQSCCVAAHTLYYKDTALTLEEANALFVDLTVSIVAVLANPVEIPLSESEIEAYKQIYSKYPNMTVVNDSGAWMEVKYSADTQIYLDTRTVVSDEQIAKAVTAYFESAGISNAEGVGF